MDENPQEREERDTHAKVNEGKHVIYVHVQKKRMKNKKEGPMGKKVKDPVCGMEIEKSGAKGPVEYKGNKYYFCADECRKKFEKEPTEYM